MRFAALFHISYLLLLGCSSSGDPPPISENGNIVGEIDSNPSADQSEANDGSTGDDTNNVNEASDDINVGEVIESDTTDPLVQNETRVNFNMTVPTYLSNELQVQLLWGDIGVNASWQVAQSWTATMDLPTNSENSLVVNFADRNGAIVLGTYEQQLTTTSNATDSYLIEADQFDTVRWDADGDGVSNLTELLAGNDPLVDESLSLEIMESLNSDGQRAMVLIGIYSQRFERSIPDERPYFDDQEVVVPRPESWPESDLFAERTQLTIDIDASGNGTYYNFRQVQHSPIDFTNLAQEGTRTRTDSSVHWTGLFRSFSAGGSCNLDNVTFMIETDRLDDGVIRQESEQNHDANCSTSNDMVGITYAVTGVTIGESEFCKAIAGTIRLRRKGDGQVSVISKTSDATHWNVNVSDRNGQLVEEYLVPSIDLEFYCEHADF